MYRYCPKCKKNYDFDIKSMDQLDSLVCPICGSKIDKNSRQPHDYVAEAKMERAIGRGINNLMWLGFTIYVILGTVGIILFLFDFDIALYILTAITIPTFLVKYARGSYFIDSAIPYLVLGGILGFMLFWSLDGICFGLMVGMIMRQVVRYLIMRLLFKALGWFSRLG